MFSRFNTSKPPQGATERAPAPTALGGAAQPATGASRAAAAPRPVASALGAGLVFEGTISGDANLSIEGSLKGDVHVTRLIVGEHALVEGSIRAQQVEVRGRVIGDIQAQLVRLAESAHVEGDIIHRQLSIEVGAHFQGHCQQFRRPEAAPTAEAATPFDGAGAEPQSAQVVDFDSARS